MRKTKGTLKTHRTFFAKFARVSTLLGIFTHAGTTHTHAMTGANISSDYIGRVATCIGFFTGTIRPRPARFTIADATVASSMSLTTAELTHVPFTAEVVAFTVVAIDFLNIREQQTDKVSCQFGNFGL